MSSSHCVRSTYYQNCHHLFVLSSLVDYVLRFTEFRDATASLSLSLSLSLNADNYGALAGHWHSGIANDEMKPMKVSCESQTNPNITNCSTAHPRIAKYTYV